MGQDTEPLEEDGDPILEDEDVPLAATDGFSHLKGKNLGSTPNAGEDIQVNVDLDALQETIRQLQEGVDALLRRPIQLDREPADRAHAGAPAESGRRPTAQMTASKLSWRLSVVVTSASCEPDCCKAAGIEFSCTSTPCSASPLSAPCCNISSWVRKTLS